MKSMKSSSKNMTITETDYIKAMRKANRELELELHGKQLSMQGPRIQKSKKAYSRKNYRIEF